MRGLVVTRAFFLLSMCLDPAPSPMGERGASPHMSALLQVSHKQAALSARISNFYGLFDLIGGLVKPHLSPPLKTRIMGTINSIGVTGSNQRMLVNVIHQPRQSRMSKEEEDSSGGLALDESKPELKQPALFKVVLINDDYTPMEFVVEVLEVFFRMNREQATHVMLTVHTQGKGVCGIFHP